MAVRRPHWNSWPRWRRRIAWLALGIVFGILLFSNTRPSLDEFEARALPATPAADGKLRVTFLGVSSLLFDDGETRVLTDGFFSRPGKLATAIGKVAPDEDRIDAVLRRLEIRHIDVVAPLHSHFDHAMDAAVVAKKTGALLVGSPSTGMIGLGGGLPLDRIAGIHDGRAMKIGRFSLTWIASRHAPSPKPMAGEIAEPLVPPQPVEAWREGGCWSLLVEHDGRRILVQSSAGVVDGALAKVQAEVVFLGVGLLSRQDDGYREHYWSEVVRGTHARRVIPIHWDDFWRSLDQPLVASPWATGNVRASIRAIDALANRDHIELRWLDSFVRTDPFAGLTIPSPPPRGGESQGEGAEIPPPRR